MSTTRPKPTVTFLIEVAIATSLFSLLIVGPPLWLHHNIYRESPSFPARAQADRWLANAWAQDGASCIPASTTAKVVAISTGGGWYGRLACDTRVIWWKLAAVAVAAALGGVITVLLAAWWPEYRVT